jgi:hypothetical protein
MDILKMLGELRQEREQVNVRDRSPRDSGVAKVSRKIGAKNGSRWSVYWSSRAGETLLQESINPLGRNAPRGHAFRIASGQFASGRWIRSITSISMGAFVDSNLRPNCS